MQQFITSAVDIESAINNFIFSFVNLVDISSISPYNRYTWT